MRFCPRLPCEGRTLQEGSPTTIIRRRLPRCCRKWSNNFPFRPVPDARRPLQTRGNFPICTLQTDPERERDKGNPWIGIERQRKQIKLSPRRWKTKKIFAFYDSASERYCFEGASRVSLAVSFTHAFRFPRPRKCSPPNLRKNVNPVITDGAKREFLVPDRALLRGIACQSVPSVTLLRDF